MNAILILAGEAHSASSGGVSTIEIVAWIGIPLFLALCGAVFGIIKGSIRFAQYMVKSEESQESTAESNKAIQTQLQTFIENTNHHLGVHDQEIAVLKFAVNGHRPPRNLNDGT